MATSIAITMGTLERMALDIRGLARSEAGELAEPFPPGKKGSSAMPHKRNPEKSERISGLARLCRGYAVTALEDQGLWHERDISHSSAERVIIADATTVLVYALRLMTEIIAGLEVRPQAMQRNLWLGGGVLFSEAVLSALVTAGLGREEAYAVVQRHALAALDGGTPFREALAADSEVQERLTPTQLDACFDLEARLRHVETILRRAGVFESKGD